MSSKSDTETKQLIKETARKLFEHFGFQKTSLDDIARQCRLSKQALYYYYSNKEALFDEILLEEAQEIFRKVENSIELNLPADQKFIQFSVSIYKNLARHAEKIGNAPNGFIDYSPHGRPIVEKIRQLFRQRLLTILQEGVQQGIFRIEDE